METATAMAPPELVEEFKEAMEGSLTWKVDIAIETGCAKVAIKDFPCYDGRIRDVDITMPLRALKGGTVSINDIRFRTDSGPFPSPFVMDNGRLQGIRERGDRLNGREEIINLITDVISWDSVGTVARSPWRLAASTCRDEFLRRAILEEVQRYREIIRGIQKPGSDAFLPDDNITRIELSPKACKVIEELVLGDPRHECGGTLIGSICRDDSTGRTIAYVDDVYTDWEYGGSAEYEFSAETMMESLLYARREYGRTKRFIGTFHSHAGYPPFFSDVDKTMMSMRRGAEVHLVISPSRMTYTACFKDVVGTYHDANCTFPGHEFPFRRV